MFLVPFYSLIIFVNILGKIRVPSKENDASGPSTNEQHIDIHLNNDELYDQLQDQHIYAIGSKIREVLNELREEEKVRDCRLTSQLSIALQCVPKNCHLSIFLEKFFLQMTLGVFLCEETKFRMRES